MGDKVTKYMTYDDIFETDLAFAEQDFPQVITYKGKEYSCVADTQTDGMELLMAGQDATGSLKVMLRISLFDNGNTPKEAETIIYKGKGYKVSHIESLDNIAITLVCNSIQGR